MGTLMHDVLALDIAGMPVRWIDHEAAAGYYASGKVRWELGEARTVLRSTVRAGKCAAMAIGCR
jgi:hypothetical protein